MRILLLALALVCAACSRDAAGPDGSLGGAGGYRLEVRATDAEQIYLVTTPQGRVVAARASAGDSALLDAGEIRALADQPAPGAAPTSSTATTHDDNHVSIHAPGVSIEAQGDDNDKANGEAHISLNFGGHGMQIDASGHNGGDPDHAHVVITGADARAARNFVAEAEHLSPEVQAQMLAALGLSEAAK